MYKNIYGHNPRNNKPLQQNFFFTFYGLVMESRKVSNSRSIIKSQRRNAGDGSDSIEI